MRTRYLLDNPDRVAALSEQLIQVHQSLREWLTSLREPVAEGAAADDGPEDLLTYCLGFCGAISAHHAGEDGQLLPALRAAAPGLAPVIDKLIEDHALVAGIVLRIRELSSGTTTLAPDVLLRELDGLTAILESHFSFEERRISTELDTLGPDGWIRDVFAPPQLT